MDVVAFPHYLLGSDPTRQLGLQLAEVYDIGSRRRATHAIASR